MRGDLRFSSLSQNTRKSNRLQVSLQRLHFLLSCLKDPECWSGRGLNPRPSALSQLSWPRGSSRYWELSTYVSPACQKSSVSGEIISESFQSIYHCRTKEGILTITGKQRNKNIKKTKQNLLCIKATKYLYIMYILSFLIQGIEFVFYSCIFYHRVSCLSWFKSCEDPEKNARLLEPWHSCMEMGRCTTTSNR